MTAIIYKYFPGLSNLQKDQFNALQNIYIEWNNRINVISRKDMDNFHLHHVLHSLAIGKAFLFTRGDIILDVGTGGGFPGIPLAILFPDTKFVLLDSIQKKIKVVTEVINHLKLRNAQPLRARVEEHPGRYDYVISRAVTSFPAFVEMTWEKLKKEEGRGGIIYLKGGDLTEELFLFRDRIKLFGISEFFDEPFFDTKKIIFLPSGS